MSQVINFERERCKQDLFKALQSGGLYTKERKSFLLLIALMKINDKKKEKADVRNV